MTQRVMVLEMPDKETLHQQSHGPGSSFKKKINPSHGAKLIPQVDKQFFEADDMARVCGEPGVGMPHRCLFFSKTQPISLKLIGAV